MSSEILTVETTAAALRVHPKTLLRFIHDGRLRATKVGKQYRILRSDLDAFAGADTAPAGRQARTTSIVDIDAVDVALLQRLSSVLLGAAQGQGDTPVSVDIAHDRERNSAKVILVASPADTSMLLKLVDACLAG